MESEYTRMFNLRGAVTFDIDRNLDDIKKWLHHRKRAAVALHKGRYDLTEEEAQYFHEYIENANINIRRIMFLLPLEKPSK